MIKFLLLFALVWMTAIFFLAYISFPLMNQSSTILNIIGVLTIILDAFYAYVISKSIIIILKQN